MAADTREGPSLFRVSVIVLILVTALSWAYRAFSQQDTAAVASSHITPVPGSR